MNYVFWLIQKQWMFQWYPQHLQTKKKLKILQNSQLKIIHFLILLLKLWNEEKFSHLQLKFRFWNWSYFAYCKSPCKSTTSKTNTLLNIYFIFLIPRSTRKIGQHFLNDSIIFKNSLNLTYISKSTQNKNFTQQFHPH